MDMKPVLPLFENESRILAVYLLGSANAGRMRPNSDIDLAILPEPGCGIADVERLDLGAKAAFQLCRDVDLGLISSANLVYAREAILTGSRIFERDAGRADLAETNLLGMYVNFNEERRDVVDAYSA